MAYISPKPLTSCKARRIRRILNKTSRRANRPLGEWEPLEERICLSTYFDYAVIAQTGPSLGAIQPSASINDAGKVAFVADVPAGGQAIFVGDGTTTTNITPGFQSPSRTFGRGIQINNSDIVVAVDRDSLAGSTAWRLRTWDADLVENQYGNTYLTYAVAGTPRQAGDDFDSIFSFASINNNDNVAYSALDGTVASLRFQDVLSVGDNQAAASLPAPQSFRPMAAGQDRLIAKLGADPSDPIVLFEQTLSGDGFTPTYVATAAMGYDAIGRSPGISDDGTVVAFYADRATPGTDPGPGIFLTDLLTGKTVRVASAGTGGNGTLDPGETYEDLNFDGQFTPSAGEVDFNPIASFESDSRVAVSVTQDDQRAMTIVYLATDTLGREGLYASRVRFRGVDDQPLAEPLVSPPLLVAQQGMEIPGAGVVSDLDIYDPVNNVGFGDIAFWADTSGGTTIVRATLSSTRILDDSVRVGVNSFDPGEIRAEFAPAGGAMSLADAAVLHGIDHFNWVQTITFPDRWTLAEVTAPIAAVVAHPYGHTEVWTPSQDAVTTQATVDGKVIDPLVQDGPAGSAKFLAIQYNEGGAIDGEYIALQDTKLSQKYPGFDPPDNKEYYQNEGGDFDLDAHETTPLALLFYDRPDAGKGAYRDGEAAAFETTLVGVAADGSRRNLKAANIHFQWRSNAEAVTDVALFRVIDTGGLPPVVSGGISAVEFTETPPGISVSPAAGLVTSELGSTATFSVSLEAPPTAIVSIDVASDKPQEGTASPSRLVFTPENWDIPQVVTLTGHADDVQDGDQSYTIILSPAVSDDARYNGIDPPDVVATNQDLPSAGPRVVSVSQLDGAPAGHLRIAIDFSEAMDSASASQVANYAIGLRGGAGLQILSATYADAGDLHRVTLEAAASGGTPLTGGTYDIRVNPQNLKSAAGAGMAGFGDDAVVLVNDLNSVVSVGLQGDTGLLGVLQTSPLGSGPPTSLVVSDFTRDSIADIVTIRPSIVGGDKGGGQMLFLRGLGSGRFADPVAYDLDQYYNAVKVIEADWNGDGSPDVIVGAYQNHSSDGEEKLYVYLNDGQGQFTRAPETPFLVTNTSSTHFAVPGSIEAMDLLPNPGPEIVAFKQGYHNYYGGTDQPGEIQIIGKDPFLGYGRLATIPLGVAMYPDRFAFADFNGDGRPDILVSGSSLVLVPSSGAADFGAARDISFQHVGNYSGSLAGVGDVTGDGKLDIVLVHDEYSNNEDVNDGDVITVLAGDGHGNFTEVSRTLMNRRGSSLLALKDMDGDGKLDLVLGETWDDGPDGYAGYNWPDVAGPSTWVWKGDGKGHFTQPATLPTLLSAGAGNFFTAWALADLDNDGDLDAIDAIAASARLALALNDGRGNLDPNAVVGPFFGSAQVGGMDALAAGDLNRDGLPDLVKVTSQTIEILVGQPGGGFRPHDSINVPIGGYSVSSVALGDLNGDGILDIVTGGNSVIVLIGRGDASFAPPTFYELGNQADVSKVALSDVNRDGKLDAIATISQDPDFYFAVLFGDGTGQLVYNLNTRISTPSRSDLAVADFDGDGKIDILDTSSSLKIFHGKGDGTFTAGATSHPAHLPGYVEVIDLNGDGRPDLIGLSSVNNFTGEFYAYVNDGTGHFAETFAGPTDGRALALTAGDFDADGNTDVLVGLDGLDIFGQGERDALLFYRGDGRGGFEPFQRLAAGGSSATAIVAQPSASAILAGSIDLVAPSTIQFGAAKSTVGEGAGTATITVTRSGGLGRSMTVAFATADGTAHAGADYFAASGTLTFEPGEASRSITIPILDDDSVEGDETVLLTLTDPNGGATLGDPHAATLTIVDNDRNEQGPGPGQGSGPGPGSGSFVWELSSYTVDENEGSITLTIRRAERAADAVSVRVVTVGGDAEPGVQYLPVDQTLTFAPGETSKTVVIPILDDGVPGGDRSFSVILRDPTTGEDLGPQAAVSVVIRNTNPLPMVGLAGVRTVLDRRKSLTQVVISLSGAVDPTQATRIATYRLAIAGRGGSFTARKGVKILKLRSATYDPATHSVTVTLAKPLKLKKPVQLRIAGLAPSGLSDAYGRLIDGDRDGQPGGDAVAVLNRQGISLGRIATAPAAGLVDTLLEQGTLNGLLPRPSRRYLA